MSVNAAWSEPEAKKLAEVVKEALKDVRGVKITLDDAAMYVTERLIAAGYSKADVGLPPYLNRLTYELKDFRESLGRIIEGTRLLKLTDEKAGQIESIMEHAKNRQEGR